MGEKKEGGKKKNGGEKKVEGGVTKIVLKVDMHCEGCAKKVKRSVNHFAGVESVKADCESNTLTVVGNVDPTKIKERVEEKIKKKVELVTLQPNKPLKQQDAGAEKKQDAKKKSADNNNKSDAKISEEKKKDKPKEPTESTVVLKTSVHCEGCAQKIRKIAGKCQGVKDVNVDLQKDTITLKGSMDMKELLPYFNRKLKRIVELAQPKKDEGGGGDKKPKQQGGENHGGSSEKQPKQGGGDKKDKKKEVSGGEVNVLQENIPRMEVYKMEYGNPYGGGYGDRYIYDPRQQYGGGGGDGEGSSSGGIGGYNHQVAQYWHEPAYSHPPQMFSDENPNACSVM